MEFDVLIRNGDMIDGAGKPARKADVGVEGDRITAVGDLEGARAAREIDASGLAVAPGFIDVHSHFDWLIMDPNHSDLLSPLLKQGVTTLVTGNCGFSPAPFRKGLSDFEMRKMMVQLLGDTVHFGSTEQELLPWRSMGEFLDHLDRQGVAFNIAQLVGHWALHLAVKGEDTSPPNPDEMEQMKNLARQSLEAGAYGLSIGLGYSPGIFSPQEEIIEIAKLTSGYDAMFPAHLQAYSWVSPAYEEIGGDPHNLISVRDFIRIGEMTGRPVHISHLIFLGRKTWEETSDAVFGEIDKAVARGVEVGFDHYSYTGGASIIAVIFPAWALPDLENNLKDPVTKANIRAEVEMAQGMLQWGFDDLTLLWGASPSLTQYEGMTVNEIADARGEDAFDSYCRLVLDSKALARIYLSQCSGNEDDDSVVRRLLAHPLCSFETDCLITRTGWQLPHSRGNYPRILGHFVRELKLMPLEEAIRKMTSLPAHQTGLKDRGLIAKGYAADLVVFNPDTIADGATLKNPCEESVGIEHVLLNGRVVVDSGVYSPGQLNGKVLRKT